MNWWTNLKGKVALNEPLKKHTTFKIGGKAKFFVEPEDAADLKILLRTATQHRIPLYVIGMGSNVLAPDNGIDGVVLRLSAPYFKNILFKNNHIQMGSGVLLSEAVLRVRDHGLSGIEFLTGIPGTVGGALAMNAGTSDKSIGDLVQDVTVMDYRGGIKRLDKRNIDFGYRKSSLAKYIILSARIKLAKKNKSQINEKIKNYISYRKLTQDSSRPSAGCIFKNPKGASAGRLIDICGLKGKRIGGACVSLKHANFILNTGKAKARDILRLVKFIKRRVKDKFNIVLEPEIKIWR